MRDKRWVLTFFKRRLRCLYDVYNLGIYIQSAPLRLLFFFFCQWEGGPAGKRANGWKVRPKKRRSDKEKREKRGASFIYLPKRWAYAQVAGIAPSGKESYIPLVSVVSDPFNFWGKNMIFFVWRHRLKLTHTHVCVRWKKPRGVIRHNRSDLLSHAPLLNRFFFQNLIGTI